MNIVFKLETAALEALRMIKPLAIELKKEIKFSEALNLASKEMGFKNYKEYMHDYMHTPISLKHN